MKESCVRNEGRDNGLTLADWREFFAKNPTPFVYSCADLTKALLEKENIVAFISNVEFHDTYFTYDITAIKEDLVEEGTMFRNLSTTIEPVYGAVKRYGCADVNLIYGIEYTNRG